MAVTPVDIAHRKFKTAISGYNKSQVDEFVKQVQETLEEMIQDRAELNRKVTLLQDELDRMKKIETAMTEALTLAQKSADELRANAHRQAEMILSEAEQARVRMMVESQRAVEKLRAEVQILDDARLRIESELRATLKAHLEWLDNRKCPEETKAEVA